MHSASPRLRALDGVGASPSLAPIAEPKLDFAHAIARKALSEHHLPNPKSKLRVDAFLGEWMNPQYYEQITPPPPSALMVATAKAELMQNEQIDVYTPTISSKSSTSNLWGGTQGTKVTQDGLDDWSHVRDALPAPSARRDRATSVNSGESSDTGSGRRSPFRPGHVMHSQSSTLPKFDTTAYVPPTPSYAVSASDHIPRGYVTHARNATVNADYQWDSSRYPQNWGDGGEYGEEWSAMHKRFRKGLNHMIHWYSENGPDERNEDSLGFEQADHQAEDADEEVEEHLVVVMVTHGAGSNALIGAITEQPVLLDVGMASLTMAVRREDAPPSTPLPDVVDSPNQATPAQSPICTSPVNEESHGSQHRSSSGTGLSAVYEMKIVASTEHLRPGSDPAKTVPSAFTVRSGLANDPPARIPRRGDATQSGSSTPVMAPWNMHEDRDRHRNQSSALGSMRRPGAANVAAPVNLGPGDGIRRRATQPALEQDSLPTLSGASTPNSAGAGLWTPPAGRTPILDAQREKEEKKTWFSSLKDSRNGGAVPGDNMVLDFSNSPPDSRPGSSGGPKSRPDSQLPVLALDGAVDHPSIEESNRGPSSGIRRESQAVSADETGQKEGNGEAAGAPLAPIPSAESERDAVPELPSKQNNEPLRASDSIPDSLSRKLSQKGLWGSRPSGDEVKRSWAGKAKRRWTVSDQDGNG